MIKRRRGRVLLFSGLALLAALVPAGLASGNPVLDGIGFLDCATEAATTPDADAAAALDAAGYDCTRLFNKPTIDNANPQQVGQLWYQFSDTSPTVLRMRVLLFSGGNTGFGDSKVCLDDDGNPINNVASGAPAAPTCLGNEVHFTLNQSGNNGPTYTFARSADGREEPAGKLELAVEKLTEVSETFAGAAVGGWNVNLGTNANNMFSEVLPHFNLSGFSIVAYFQPVGQVINCGVENSVTISDPNFANIEGTVTLRSVDGQVGGETCPPKPYTSAVAADALAFVPDLDGTQAHYTIDVTVANQTVSVDGNGAITSLVAEYDPTGNLNFDDATDKPLKNCNGQPILDPSAPGYQAFWSQTSVGLLPAGETACFYRALVTTTGTGVGTEDWGIYFLDDPGFGFK